MSLYPTQRKLAQQALQAKREQVAEEAKKRARLKRRRERMPQVLEIRRHCISSTLFCLAMLFFAEQIRYDLLFFFEEHVVVFAKCVIGSLIALNIITIAYINLFYLPLEDSCLPLESSSGGLSCSDSGEARPPS